MELKEEIDEEENKHYEKYIECTDTSKPQENSLSNDFNTQTCEANSENALLSTPNPYVTTDSPTQDNNHIPHKKTSLPKMRTGMSILMIICLIYVVMGILAGISAGDPGMSVGVGGFFGILSGMFFILAKNPKHSKSILIRKHMVSKNQIYSTLCSFCIRLYYNNLQLVVCIKFS